MAEFLITLGDPAVEKIEVYSTASHKTLREAVNGVVTFAKEERIDDIRVWQLTNVSVKLFNTTIEGLDALLASK